MPANKYALLRYRIIDKCIRNKYRPYPAKEDLRSACEEALYGSDGTRISTSTIEKDLWAMRYETELGYEAPIRFDKVHRGYYYEDPEYSIDAIPLNEDDVEAIRFAATTLFQFKDVELFKQFGSAIDKIFDRLNITANGADTGIDRYVQFETIPFIKGSEYLSTILEAIRGRHRIRFHYASFARQGEKEYTLEPYLLKEYRNRWYVIGYDPTRESTVTFGLDRIVRLDPTDHQFEVLAEFDPDRFFKHSIGITAHGGAAEQVVLSFTPAQGKYIKTQPIHASQTVEVDNDQEFRIAIHVLITYELIMQILGYGKEVTVMAPASLQQRITALLQEALDRYEASGN